MPVDPTIRRPLAILLSLLLCATSARAQNFVIHMSNTSGVSDDFNQQVVIAAEDYRRDLAIRWLGKELPRWASPCPITLQVGPHLGAGGATSFVFDHGEVFNWQMQIQGSPERIVDSVLPHEVTHTILATHFRQALPRWADEGASTTAEHASERRRMESLLHEFLRTNRGIAFNDMFAMKQYPDDVLPLYSQGHSVSRFLLEHAGPRQFVTFLEDGMANHTRDGWEAAVQTSYGYRSLGELQTTWLDWVSKGSPPSGRVVGYPPCSGGSCNGGGMGGGPIMVPARQSFAGGSWSGVNDGSGHQPTLSAPSRPRVPIDELGSATPGQGPAYDPNAPTIRPLTPVPQPTQTQPSCPTFDEDALVRRLELLIDAKIAALPKPAPGPSGPPGPAGPQGPAGPAGNDGANGTAGTAVEIDYDKLAKALAKEVPPGLSEERVVVLIKEHCQANKPDVVAERPAAEPGFYDLRRKKKEPK